MVLKNLLRRLDLTTLQLDPERLPILVVEDEPQVQLIYESYFRGSRYQAIMANSVRAATAALERFIPVAILLDILLVGEDSWLWLAQTKANSRTSGIPIIISSDLDERRKGLALGAEAYFVKPPDREALLGALARLTG